jgi:outer membrane protein TolC
VTASRLNNILVRPLTSDIQGEDIRDVSPQLVEADRERAWEAAEKQRPEIQIAEETLKALDLDKTAKKSGYYPFFLKSGLTTRKPISGARGTGCYCSEWASICSGAVKPARNCQNRVRGCG